MRVCRGRENPGRESVGVKVFVSALFENALVVGKGRGVRTLGLKAEAAGVLRCGDGCEAPDVLSVDYRISGSFPVLQMLVHKVYRQSHYVKVTAFDLFNCHHSDPILRTVRAGFVEGLMMIDIIGDLFRRE